MQTLSLRWQTWMAKKTRPRPPARESALRAELFSVEELASHAKVLAGYHQVVSQRGSHSLLARLDQNEQILRDYNRATYATDQTRRVTHAAEWLLDNFYLIEEQIQMARRHLPRNYSRELSCLRNGPSAGLPRVYDIVLELISHVDAQIDAESLRAFVAAYQTVSSLKVGELWAVPIMLRLALIENLRRVAAGLMIARHGRDIADLWVDRLQDMAEKHPSHLVVVVADMAKAELPLSSAFVAEFCQRLSRQNPVVHLARSWLEQRLAEQGLSLEQLVHLESQNQAADQVSVSHTITSLRFLGATDWRGFVEDLSVVDQTLRTDPAAVYGAMDFSTRDRYRHSIEALARHSQFSETDVAHRAIQMAEVSAREKGRHDRTAHVGYYLIDKGQAALESETAMRWPWSTALERVIHRFPMTIYAGGILLLTALGTLGLLHRAVAFDVQGWRLIFFAFVFLLCASQLAVVLLNWLSTLLVKPRLLPRLDYSKGIAPDCRTMVAVPTMLTSADAIDRLVETIEIHYLANRDSNLYFALLTDFRDAPEETMPEDKALLQRVQAGIEGLNKKYESDRPSIFFLFHRPRRWNTVENLWMGYERKRGKLMEFNALLRGGSSDCFSARVGDPAVLPGIRFVITLDTDTQLPREAARQLVGTIAHPLNRPQFDPVRGIVTEGYSILQPRVGVSLPSAGRSWFVKLFAGDVGIDPYTRAVSDVYQDMFKEGSFIGKGIYDVDAFQQAVAGRFPENALLSHDLIESCHARSALVSDVELYEEYPARYNTDINRRHRWIRGDWQIAQWLLPRVPGPDARRIANPLSGLSQWKIFDNLRRSLVPAALVLLLLGNWMLLPELAGIGPLLVLAIVALPGVLSSTVEMFRKPEELPLALHFRGMAASCGRQLGQAFLTFVFLPYDAFISLDAISRTLLRLLITHKRLLEWQTAGDSERAACADLVAFYKTMWITPVVALASGCFLAVMQRYQLPLAAPILGLWLVAPWIAWRISQPLEPPVPALQAEQLAFLRKAARRTWRFFETFVTAQENWLPPDNFQEEPVPVIASRTSPTNMGLALLANLAACDFGYLPVGQLMQRTQNAFATMQNLERQHGHFYNWYETRTLKPLLPLYISSVDSGNLAGHLLTLGAGLEELSGQPILTPQLFPGLRDTVGILRELAGENPEMKSLDAKLANAPATLSAGFALLQQVTDQATRIAAALGSEAGEELKWWSQALERSCQEHLADLLFLAPWLALAPQGTGIRNPKSEVEASLLPSAAPTLDEKLSLFNQFPTLREVSELEHSLCPLIEAALQACSGESAQSEKEEATRLAEWLPCLREASDRARQRMLALETLARQSSEFAAMDFNFLFDPARKLFSIGYNVTERRLDASFYDLLASEARLCSYVAIAQGQVSQDHWFSLGRLLVASLDEPVLASWNGSLFEYLMPVLVMPTYDNTLLDQSYHGAVAQQIAYGQLHGVPWGVSESGYNRTDVHLNYQYRAFGVPGLGLKRGLAEDLVIAPYAALMALMVAPREACENLERLSAERRALALTAFTRRWITRLRVCRPVSPVSPSGRSWRIIKGWACWRLLISCWTGPCSGASWRVRFSERPTCYCRSACSKPPPMCFRKIWDWVKSESWSAKAKTACAVFTDPSLHAPEVHLLSNGQYHVVVSSAGGGYSRWRDLAVTRWREDATRDCWGTFFYLRDVETGEFWSAAYQPTVRDLKGYEAIFTQARAIPPTPCRPRNPHGNQCVAGGRCGGAASDTHQSLAHAAEHRTDQLRGGCPRDSGGGRGPSRLQQSVRANGIREPASRSALHPPPSLRRREAAVAAEFDGRAGRRTGRHFMGN